MTKKQFLILLGVWVILFLFLHFPSTWDKIFAVLTGLLVIIVAFKFKTPSKTASIGQVPYVEHKSSAQPRIVPEESGQKIQDITNNSSPLITS